MYIEFVRSGGENDISAPVINTAGNGLVLATAGTLSGLIIALALKALGFIKIAMIVGSLVPFTIAFIGFTCGAIIGALAVSLIWGIYMGQQHVRSHGL